MTHFPPQNHNSPQPNSPLIEISPTCSNRPTFRKFTTQQKHIECSFIRSSYNHPQNVVEHMFGWMCVESKKKNFFVVVVTGLQPQQRATVILFLLTLIIGKKERNNKKINNQKRRATTTNGKPIQTQSDTHTYTHTLSYSISKYQWRISATFSPLGEYPLNKITVVWFVLLLAFVNFLHTHAHTHRHTHIYYPTQREESFSC